MLRFKCLITEVLLHIHTQLIFLWHGGLLFLSFSCNCIVSYLTPTKHGTETWRTNCRSACMTTKEEGRKYKAREVSPISGVATDCRVGGGGGVMISKPTYPQWYFSSFLGHFILLRHRLHTFRYCFENKNKKKSWHLCGGLGLGLMFNLCIAWRAKIQSDPKKCQDFNSMSFPQLLAGRLYRMSEKKNVTHL